MSQMLHRQLTEREIKVLSAVEDGFPICSDPWTTLADQIGLTEAETVRLAEELHLSGYIKRFGLTFNSRKLGYFTALCAARKGSVDNEKIRAVAENYSGITHCYQREDDEYEIWFTMMARSEAGVADDAASFVLEAGLSDLMILPAVKMFKLDVRFMTGEAYKPKAAITGSDPLELSQSDRNVIRELQSSIPLTLHPFEQAAEKLEMPQLELLDVLGDLSTKGALKRFGGIVDHKRIGTTANLLAAYRVDRKDVEELAEEVIRMPEVSHLYLRKRAPGWDFDLYAMIHSTSREQCLISAMRILNTLGAEDLRPMFTVEEIKRSVPQYT